MDDVPKLERFMANHRAAPAPAVEPRDAALARRQATYVGALKKLESELSAIPEAEREPRKAGLEASMLEEAGQ